MELKQVVELAFDEAIRCAEEGFSVEEMAQAACVAKTPSQPMEFFQVLTARLTALREARRGLL